MLTLNVAGAVVLMDGDLQDHPEDIPLLYTKVREGHEVVYGVKMSLLSDYDVDFNTSMFRIMSRRVVDELCRFRERIRASQGS